MALVLSLAGGFWIDPTSFGSNVLAELAGVVVGIGAAVLVVERLLDQDRRARWHLVDAETIGILRLALVKSALPLYHYLPAPRPPDADPHVYMDGGRDLGSAMKRLAAALRGHEVLDLKPERLRCVLEKIGPHVNFVRDVVMQRLLIVGPDPELVKRLVVLDATYENLDFDAWLEDVFDSRPGQIAQKLAELADAMGEVVRYIDSPRAAARRS